QHYSPATIHPVMSVYLFFTHLFLIGSFVSVTIIVLFFFFFFFNDPATTEIYTLSLHDALPIWCSGRRRRLPLSKRGRYDTRANRSEEHTSELQSPDHLVCRLLLEKKKKYKTQKLNLNIQYRFNKKNTER